QLSAPLIPNPSPSRGEGGSFGSTSVFAAMSPKAALLPLREKVAAKRSDEGCAEVAKSAHFGAFGQRSAHPIPIPSPAGDEGGAEVAQSARPDVFVQRRAPLIRPFASRKPTFSHQGRRATLGSL